MGSCNYRPWIALILSVVLASGCSSDDSKPLSPTGHADAAPEVGAGRLDAVTASDGPAQTDAPFGAEATPPALDAGGGEAASAPRDLGIGTASFLVLPAAIDLGTVAVGVMAIPQTLTVTTVDALADLAFHAEGPDVTIDGTASTCTAVLAAGASCKIVVDFTAASAGSKQDTIVVSGGGPNGKTLTVGISAAAVISTGLVVVPNTTQSLTAGPGASTTIKFVVANPGNTTLGPLAVGLTGAGAADFSVTTTCLLLPAQGTCEVSVTYHPTTGSTATSIAVLTIADAGAGGSQASVPLMGSPAAGPATLTITPAAGDLGSALVGTTGVAASFTLTNTAQRACENVTLTLSSPEFIIVSDACSAHTLATGETCTISLALHPATVGAKSATLTVSGTGVAPVTKILTGTGMLFEDPVLTPAALDFGAVAVGQTSAGQTVTLRNTGGGSTGTLSLIASGNAASFPVTANTCVGTLAASAACTFTVAFAPTSTGTASAIYTITDGMVSAAVTMSGTGE